MKNIKRIIGTLCFLLLFYAAFTGTSNLLMHKQVEGQWNMTAKVAGFYNEKPNSFDVMFFGSSHMYCSIDPAVIKEETGLSSYVFATQQQPLWITYHYIIEALKTQSPKIICVEVHMASISDLYMDDATNHSAIDPIPLSKNKIDMINAAAPKGKRRFYYFDIMAYHDRWKELEKLDYVRKYEKGTDPDKGYVRLTTAAINVERPDLSDARGRARISAKNREYVNKIIDLTKEKGIRLILVKAPSNATVRQEVCYNGVAAIAAERGVEYIDYNNYDLYRGLMLNRKTDFYDGYHLNESGMRKFDKEFCRRFLMSGEKTNL